jgi:hypothetical protein
MSRQSDLDNHANQLNPNNDAYWQSRGCDDRPSDWEKPIEQPNEDHEVKSPPRDQAKK